MYNYGATCAPALTGMGWANGFYGLGAANPAAIAARKSAAAARKAARLVKIAGRNVKTTASNSAPEKMAALMNQLKSGANAAFAKISTARTAIARAKQTRNPKDRATAVAAATAARNTATAVLKNIQISHQGGTATPAPRLRGFDDGLGLGDCSTNIDDSTGQPYTDPSICGGGSTYAPVTGGSSYYPQSYGGSTGLTTGLNTGITPGFGSPFGGGGIGIPPLTQPSGCSGNSNLPRCLIYNMAQSEQTQFYFVFSVMEQMYAQLLQIVNQLMTELQSVQQQPPPYYGQQGPYGQPPYGQPPFDPNNPYGNQYGGAGPYGYGSPYGPSSSQIPAGYDTGGDGSIPTDITQAFPGPGPMPQGIPSSDGPLPSGAGPGNDASAGGDDAGNLMPQGSTQMQMPNAQTAPGQSVNVGPNQPVPIIISVQSPGQSPYADAQISQAPQVNQGGDGGTVSAEGWE